MVVVEEDAMVSRRWAGSDLMDQTLGERERFFEEGGGEIDADDLAGES